MKHLQHNLVFYIENLIAKNRVDTKNSNSLNNFNKLLKNPMKLLVTSIIWLACVEFLHFFGANAANKFQAVLHYWL